MLLAALALGALAGLAGCSETPTAGPRVAEIEDEQKQPKDFGFTLVPVGPQVVAATQTYPMPRLRQTFPDDGAHQPVVGPGDVLAVTIFEAGSGGLFSSGDSGSSIGTGSKSVTLPMITVDRSGRIRVPFVGTVQVNGRTPAEIGIALEAELHDKAVQPQVMVTVTNSVSNAVVVMGAAKVPGRYNVTAAGETLLQMVTQAGGPTGLATDTLLELTRGGVRLAVPLQDLIDHPLENIHARPGDYINLVLQPRTFTVFGAAGKANEYPLDVAKLSLAQAVARAGGLRDLQADARGIFLLRYEYPQVLSRLPAAVPPPPSATPDGAAGPLKPVAYEINLKTAEGYFMAQQFMVREKDLIYVPVAPTVDWQKVLDLFRFVATPAIDAADTARISSGL